MSRRRTSAAILLLASALLGGCSTWSVRLPYNTSADHGPRFEKKIFFALTALKATDEQRLKVLQAFDEADPQLSTLGAESDRLRSSWRKLDPRAADYGSQVDALAQHEGQVSGEKLRVRAEFNRKVAAVLDRNQWIGWTNLFHVGSLNEDGDPDDFHYLGPSYNRAASY